MLNTFGPGSMEPSRSIGSDNIPGPPRMEGFGSEEMMRSPFNYGSVQDGMYGADKLEKKLKKQYWKAKQSVIEKLGKSQDEFVVAGDADIDTKLERAYHLSASCQELLQSLDKYSNRLRAVTNHELLMGEHLNVWSETEYTNAGEVMQKVGKLQQQDAKARLGLIPALMRIQQESLTFRDSAIRDLAISIQLLEKARSEYRAALLWMKDVSVKLQNPDYRDQLAKFRESQATVKETKQKFERLKRDLSEKISMVSASRCNLLSRLLPIYQKEFLAFTDKWAGEYHKIMDDLRSHHHHQYKLRNLMDEIRDLEVEETAAFELPPPDSVQAGPSGGQFLDDDEPLIDMGGSEPTSSTSGQQQQKQEEEEEESEQSFANSLLDLEREAKVNDIHLSGIEAELPTLQEPADQPEDTQPPQPPPSSDTPASTGEGIGNLLELSPQHQTSSDSSGQDQTDQLFDEWSSFSILMPTTKPESSSSDWEKEFMQDTSDSTQDPLFGLDPLGSSSTVGQEKDNKGTTQSALDALDLALHPTPTPAGDGSEPPVLSADSTLDELLGMKREQPEEGADLMAPSTTTAPPPSSLTSPPASDRERELGSLDLAYFQEKPPPPTLPNPSLQPYQSPLLPTMQQRQMLPVAPTFPPPLTAGQGAMFRSPLMTSQGPIFPPQQPLGGATAPGSGGALPLPKRGSKEDEKKESSWMNVFAHLDPLVNEKV